MTYLLRFTGGRLGADYGSATRGIMSIGFGGYDRAAVAGRQFGPPGARRGVDFAHVYRILVGLLCHGRMATWGYAGWKYPFVYRVGI